MGNKDSFGKFLGLALMCFLVYLTCYSTKNLLSVNTPKMAEEGYSEVAIGAMSSVYFMSYGVGQLFTGFIGDKAGLKYMLLFGLLIASVSCFFFALFDSVIVKSIVWGACGFGLSFLYAPLVKSVSEHLQGRQAEICMTLLNFASIIGSTVAGVFGAFGNWRVSTYIFAAILAFLAVSSFVFNIAFDRRWPVLKQMEKDGKARMPLKEFKNYWLKTGGIVFIFISAIQGIGKNSITFWIPTYISQYLAFKPETAAIIFSVITLLTAANQIIAIWLYHIMKKRAMRVVRFSFAVSAVCFLLLIPVKNVWANLVFLLVATSGFSWAGTMIWTYYCRRYADVGRVAFVVGFLDFVSYAFSAVSSLCFSDAISAFGWTWLIMIWSILMLCGVLVSFVFYNTTKEI